jgi:dTDP-4-amino-4,6-dideoxygalactose transaminase
MQVPFLDLRAHHEPLMDEFVNAFRQVTDASAFAGGPFVARFETEFAGFCGSRHALGLASGTDALWLSLLALGVGPGDEVITVPNSFMATAEAISLCGARPVFVDVDPETYTMDPEQLEAAITLRTQAIIPVHLFGQTAAMDEIMTIARRHGTPVVEDACQAHGASYKGRKAGSIGVAKYLHSMIGWNARMDGIQAAVLSVKMRRLAAANEARRVHARLYNDLLADEPRVIRPVVGPDNTHVYHIYAVRVQDRDGVLQRMAARGVHCAIHYPVPIHRQKAYGFLGLGPGSFPVAEECAKEFLSLPMYPELTEEQIRFVVDSLKECLLDQEGSSLMIEHQKA